MTDTMEKKEALEQELDVQPAEVPAENAATETAPEAASEAESEAAPEEAARDEAPADDAEFSRPADVSDDGSPHGPLDFFGGEDSEKKDAEERRFLPMPPSTNRTAASPASSTPRMTTSTFLP